MSNLILRKTKGEKKLDLPTAHFDVSIISTSVVTLSNVTLCRYKKSEKKEVVF